MTSGRNSFAAETAAAPSPTEATISMSSLIPSRSSRASRKTSLSSTSTIRTGGIRPTLFRSEQKGIVRLAAFVDLDIELRMSRLEPFDEPVQRRRLGTGEEGQESTRLREQTGDDLERDFGEVVSACDWLALGETEPVAAPDDQAVELDVARGAGDLA